MRISDWSSDVCSSDLAARAVRTRSSRRPRGREAAEAAVVVVGVEELRRWAAAGYDAPRAAVARTGRAHRVLAVVAARLRRKQAFTVLERAAVLPVRVRAAALDQGPRVERLRGRPWDRTSVVLGRGVSVRVDLDGRRILQHKNK